MKRNPQVTGAEAPENGIKSAKNGAESAEKDVKIAPKTHENAKNGGKKRLSTAQKVLFSCGIICMIAGIACAAAPFLLPEETLPEINFPKIPSVDAAEDHNIYSKLTGLKVASKADVTAPTYCVQTPNGMDGARPQAGLDQAGVVFEAVAEAGITRFAAIYQAPTTAVIGPIRSLRLYYLEWDAPFDCTIVHAGGADDALAAVRSYRDLTENYTYMYRGTAGSRLWNNLFTTSYELAQFNADRGYDKSDVKGFARMTPDAAEKARVNDLAVEKLVITEPAVHDVGALRADAERITMNFGSGMANFNVVYNYNLATNSYDRSYASGAPHEIYSCPGEDLGEKNPESVCELKQLSPKVVIGMMVSETRASDGYHEDITTTGSGVAYIFQNGTAVRGKWDKSGVSSQIKFFDADGKELELIPGQTWISAIPGYGGVEY